MNRILNSEQGIITHDYNYDMNVKLKKVNFPSNLLIKVPEAIIEYYFYFLSIRDIKRLGLVNKSFYIKSEASHLWKNLFEKFSHQNVSYQFMRSLKGVTDKNIIQSIYEEKKFFPTHLKAIFGEFEYIMALPLTTLDDDIFRERWTMIDNSSVVEAMRFAPPVSKISVVSKPTYDRSSCIAIKLKAHIENGFREDRWNIVLGVCILWEYSPGTDWKISFNWLTDKKVQLEFNPGMMEELCTESQVDWFKRLLQGQKCGYRVLEDPNNAYLKEPKIKETFDRIYYTLQANP